MLLAQLWVAEDLLTLAEGCSSPCVQQEGWRGPTLGAMWQRAVQHGSGRWVRTGWKQAVGGPERCRVWDRGWKWTVQEGLGGTGQKPGPEYRDRGRWGHSCCSGLDAIPWAAGRLHILQKALIPRGHPTEPQRSPLVGLGGGKCIRACTGWCQHGVAPQQRCWDSHGGQAAVGLGQPVGTGPTGASCQRCGAAPAPLSGSHLPFMWPWLRPSTSSFAPHCSLAPPLLWSWPRPSLWLWPCPMVAPWWPVPRGQCQHSPGALHAPALGLGQQCRRVPRATAAVAQVPRVVPRARWVVLHTSHSGCQGANPTAPCPHAILFPEHQANRAGGRDSTGSGAIPTPRSKQPEGQLLDLFP